MKALSLKQPFAELIVSGKKNIELRKWNTKFRGEFLIHASKIPDKEFMKKFGFDNPMKNEFINIRCFFKKETSNIEFLDFYHFSTVLCACVQIKWFSVYL